MEIAHQPKRILIVDDDKVLGTYMENLLRARTNYDVHLESSPTAALEKIRGRAFDVIVSDIVMPGMSGTELLKHVKCLHPDTEVIMITGNATYESVRESMVLRAFDYLEKPVQSDRFLITIENALARQKLSSDLTRTLEEVAMLNGELKRRMRVQLSSEGPRQRLAGAGFIIGQLASQLAPVLEELDPLLSPAPNDRVRSLVRQMREVICQYEHTFHLAPTVKSPTSPVDLIRTHCQHLAYVFNKITLDLVLPSDGPQAHLDAGKLGLAFSIVVAEIVMAMREVGVLRVSAVTTAEGLRLELHAPDLKEVLVLPDAFAQGSLNEASASDSLGLAMARQLLLDCGATLTVTSTAGAPVVILFPLLVRRPAFGAAPAKPDPGS